jgi:hypothetical protein
MGQPASAANVIWAATWRFTVASLAVFSLWAFCGRWFYKNLGEGGFYLVCALAFIGLSGLLLQPLVRERVSLGRFYGAFTFAFMTYAVLWSAAWFLLRGKTGEWVGSIAGPIALATLLLRLTKTHPASLPLLLAVVVLHSLGYFAGDSLYAWVKSPSGIETLSTWAKPERNKLGQLLWGLTYGMGLGNAIGLVLHQIASETPKVEPAPTK